MELPQRKSCQNLSADNRLLDRDRVCLETIITDGSGKQASVRLVDISPGGFHARADLDLRKHQIIRVILPLVGDVRARVMWSLIGCFGAQFFDSVGEREYPRLLATIKTGRHDWQI